jgi:hypothetical protein
MLMPLSLSTKRSLENEGDIDFMFGGLFGISQMGSKDGLRSTRADFFMKKRAPANRKRGFSRSFRRIRGLYGFLY